MLVADRKAWNSRPRIKSPLRPFLTCATLLAALDVHPRVAMRILRHSKVAITMEIYTEALSEATCEALRKLSEQLVA